MKHIFKQLLLTLSLFLGSIGCMPLSAQAVSFNVNAKDNRNGSMTVSVSGSCVGAFNVSANGKTAQLAIKNLGGSDSTTLKTGVGTFTVKVTAISISDADYNIEENKTITKTVTVTDKAAEQHKPSKPIKPNENDSHVTKPTPKPVQPTKSTINTLDSLTVSAGELSPKFNKNKTTYSVDVTDEVQSIEINAKSSDSKAKVTGTGKHELHIGENNLQILVTSESGRLRTYTISVFVKETPKIFLPYNGKQLGVLTELGKAVLPERAVKTTVQIEGTEVDAVRVGNLVMVYLFDKDSNKADFYIYDNGSIIGDYKFLKGFTQNYIIITSSMPDELKTDKTSREVTLKIGDEEVKGYKSENMKFPIVYLMNEDGQKAWYTYDESEKTLQQWDFSTVAVEKENEYMVAGLTALGITSTFLLVGLVYQTYRFNKFKKLSLTALREYDKQQQGGEEDE